MKCSVVILNWNGAEIMRQYLPSVVRYTQNADCEVVVADNGSTDHSLEVLRNEFTSVRLICLDKNYGFAEGYNRAIEQITSEYIVLLNSDVEVTENWLTPLLRYMDEHPRVAAVQPKIHAINHRTYFEHAGAAGGYMDALGYPYCRGRILSTVEEDKGQYDTPADIFWTSGACMCVRANIYKECGGLDVGFFAHMEEIDLCWRMQAFGYRLVALPDSTVYHLGGGALAYNNPRKTYLNFRNNMLMLYKNCSTARLLWLMPVRMSLDYIAAIQMLIKGQRDNALAILKARRDFWRLRKDYRKKRKAIRARQQQAVRYQTFSILLLAILKKTGLN